MRNVAVGFDFDHTLGIDHALERAALGILAEQLAAPIDIQEPGEAALIDRLLGPFRRAEITMEQMIAHFVVALPTKGLIDAPDAAYLAECYRDICFQLVDSFVVPVDGARELVDTLLADGIPIGILTNGWSPLQEKKVARALGPFPGPVLVSDAIGAYKPSPAAFQQLGGALRCAPNELWFVGDDPATDIAGANASGLRTIWFDAYGHPFPVSLTPPLAHIRRIQDVAQIVRGT